MGRISEKSCSRLRKVSESPACPFDMRPPLRFLLGEVLGDLLSLFCCDMGPSEPYLLKASSDSFKSVLRCEPASWFDAVACGGAAQAARASTKSTERGKLTNPDTASELPQTEERASELPERLGTPPPANMRATKAPVKDARARRTSRINPAHKRGATECHFCRVHLQKLYVHCRAVMKTSLG